MEPEEEELNQSNQQEIVNNPNKISPTNDE
jgi:hypothetical protein